MFLKNFVQKTAGIDWSSAIPQWFDDLFGGRKIVGDDSSDILVGGWGDDFIVANDGNDTVYGNFGDDFILGNTGDDTLYGGFGDDIIYGGVGNDHIYGGGGDDIIDGDRGFDTLTGGTGRDTFEFNVGPQFLGDGFDIVTDFKLGQDVISIKNGDQSLVGFVDVGRDVEVYYDGVLIAELEGVSRLPSNLNDFFA
jgi:RTX toxins and related Ca2+-binding proteins